MTTDLLPLEEIVHQLVRRWKQPWPDDHRCTKDGRHVCTHHRLGHAPLLARLADMVEPGTTFTERSGSRPTVKGSPAPWDPRAAELIDEILRGAVSRVDRARQVLGLGPAWVSVRRSWPRELDTLGYPWELGYGTPLYDSRRMRLAVAPVDLAGRQALRALPGLLTRLQDTHPDHPLVRGELLVPGNPARGHRLGDIEADLRRWHAAAAVRVAGFEELPSIRWAWIDNPLEDHWGNSPSSWSGPLCPDARRPSIRRKGSHRYRTSAANTPRWEPDTAQVSCGHVSCLRIAYAAMGPRVPAWCPWCWRRSLVEDQESGVVRCSRDHPGAGVWATRAAAVDEIRELLLAEMGLDPDQLEGDEEADA